MSHAVPPAPSDHFLGILVTDGVDVVLASKQGTALLAALPAARDFVAAAFAHCKFIGYSGDAAPLFEAAGLASLIDDGFADLGRRSAADFLSRCAQLRFWPRQASMAEKAAAARG